MRLSSMSAISLSICILMFSIIILLTMASASKFTANSSSFSEWYLTSSYTDLNLISRSALSRALDFWKPLITSLMSFSTNLSSSFAFCWVNFMSFVSLSLTLRFSTYISFSSILICCLITLLDLSIWVEDICAQSGFNSSLISLMRALRSFASSLAGPPVNWLIGMPPTSYAGSPFMGVWGPTGVLTTGLTFPLGNFAISWPSGVTITYTGVRVPSSSTAISCPSGVVMTCTGPSRSPGDKGDGIPSGELAAAFIAGLKLSWVRLLNIELVRFGPWFELNPD